MKKILALLLAVVMVASLFAGCGSTTEPEATTQAATQAETPKETEAAPATSAEIPELTWIAVGGGMPANYDSWKAKVDAYLEEKIGIHLDMQIIGWGDWDNRRSVIVSTNEPYDLMFTNMGTFVSDVNMGAFADISDLIAETPGLTDLIPSDYLDACRVDGKLYGIPAYKDSSMTNYFVWSKADVEAYFPEYTEAHTLAEISDGLYALKAGTGRTPFMLNKDGLSCVTGNKYDACSLGDVGIGIAYNGGTEFVSVFEQEDVLANLALLQTWMKDGLINSDAAVLGEVSGSYTMGVAQGWPSAASTWGEKRSEEVVVSQFENTVLSNDTVLGSITCISASSKYQAEALKLLELVNTDTTLRDMLWYGEEGVNFEYVDENGTQKVNKLNGDWTMAAYTQGTFFIATPLVGEEGYAEVKELNANATASPAMGFSIDTTNIADLMSAVQAVFAEYKGLILTGTGTQADIDAMVAAMYDAGMGEILTEVNAQFAAWKAAN